MRMRSLAVPVLLLWSGAAAAQGRKPSSRDEVPMVRVTVAGGADRVYRTAFEVLDGMGYSFRALLLDHVILTLPRTTDATSALGAAAVLVQMELEPRGDSTQITLVGGVIPRDDKPCQREACERLLGASLLVSGEAAQKLTAALEHAPPLVPTHSDSLAAAGAYGYSRNDPVRVGGGVHDGAAREHAFLATLRGPAGEAVTFVRLGSCCEYPNPDGLEGKGILDAWEVTYPGLAHPLRLYLDMYRDDHPHAPQGLTEVPAAAARETTR